MLSWSWALLWSLKSKLRSPLRLNRDFEYFVNHHLNTLSAARLANIEFRNYFLIGKTEKRSLPLNSFLFYIAFSAHFLNYAIFQFNLVAESANQLLVNKIFAQSTY